MQVSKTRTFAIICILLVGETCAWTSSTFKFCRQKTSSTFGRLSPLKSDENNDGFSQDEPKLRSLSELLLPNPKCNPTQMSPTSLAYIGDSVFELFVRSRYVWPTRRTTDLQKIVVDKVRGEFIFSLQPLSFVKLISSQR
jgi:hypothetical protein